MLVIDDILAFPVRGLLFIFREICNAAAMEVADEARTIQGELSELYMMLETGRITEKEFDARERELLDRLDEIEARDDGPPKDETVSTSEPFSRRWDVAGPDSRVSRA